MTKDEALKMAIDYLELEYQYEIGVWGQDLEGLIGCCKEALEQSEWQELTDDEILAIDDVTLGDYYVESMANNFARAIEKALKEKNYAGND